MQIGRLRELGGETKGVLRDETGDRAEGGSLLQKYTGRQTAEVMLI